MSRQFVAALGLACIVPVTAVAQPVRDNRVSNGVGTAAVTGVVLTDEREPRPLRRARVSLTGAELDVGHATITADDGSFVFDRLPPGRYSLTAAKDGYVTMSVGSQRPGRPGTGVEARAGETARAVLRLPKGAVITGVVVLPTGEPASGVSVMPLVERYIPVAGERRLTNVPNSTVLTDDRGVYRIFGLAPGTYVISAVPRLTPNVVPGSDIVLLSDAEIRRALSEVKEQTFASRPGMLSARPTAPSSSEPRRGGVSLAPIYYPGTPAEKQATPVTVAAGEVRGGIDIDLEYVRTAAVEGFVPAPAGTRVQLMLTNADGTAANQAVRVSATPGDDGRFMFRSLPPGHYTIAARAVSVAARTDASPAESIFWGNTEVIVSGEDITGVSIVLRPALTIAGRIAFRGATPPPRLPTLRLPIPAMAFGGTTATSLPSVLVDGDRFRIAGAMPGIYRFQAPPQGVRGPIGSWWLESVLIGGKDLLDAELNLRDSVEDAVITFSDRASELSGVVRYDNGQPFREGLVVVFGGDRSSWFLNSRRVAALQPSKDGRYVVRNLPPGSYFITVAIGLDRNEWFDPEMLASLAVNAQRLTLGPLEVKTHDMVLSR